MKLPSFKTLMPASHPSEVKTKAISIPLFCGMLVWKTGLQLWHWTPKVPFLGTWIRVLLTKVPNFGHQKIETTFHTNIPPKWWNRYWLYAFTHFGWVWSQFLNWHFCLVLKIVPSSGHYPQPKSAQGFCSLTLWSKTTGISRFSPLVWEGWEGPSGWWGEEEGGGSYDHSY